MLETISGDEATRTFLSHTRLRPEGRGIAFLKNLTLRFAALPYENISKIIKSAAAASLEEAIRLPVEVVTEHFEKGFGGTCFSLTFLLERMLATLGFDCRRVMADMNSGPNVHCLMLVGEAGRTCMVDPGYALYEVIELPGEGSVRVRCPHALVELTCEAPGVYSLWTEDRSGRKWRYRFRDRAVADPEFEAHWLASFGKPTLRNICLNRMTPRGHMYMREDFFKFTSQGSIAKRKVTSDLEGFIEEHFGIGGCWTETALKVLAQRRVS